MSFTNRIAADRAPAISSHISIDGSGYQVLLSSGLAKVDLPDDGIASAIMTQTSNLDKQIKRHVIGRVHRLFAITAPGLEETCARELADVSDTIRIDTMAAGGVSFRGRLDDLMRANLYLRTAGRLLMRIETYKATNFRQMRKKASLIPWNRYLPSGCVPRCSVVAHQSRLYHTRAAARRLEASIADYWRDALVGVASPSDMEQTLYVRIDQDVVTLSLDSSGPNLYQRGIKTHTAKAPLRETLAAGILRLADYRPGEPLIDPMCGSGTFSLEAALMAKRIVPGRFREFAFMQWPAFRPRRWRYWTALADRRVEAQVHPAIFASDEDEAACRRLQATVHRFDLADAIEVACRDFFRLDPLTAGGRDLEPGLVVLNPPYGRRLAADRDATHLYHRIGQKLSDGFRGWRAAVLMPRADLIGTLPLRSRPIKLHHGGLTLYLQVGRVV